jgi:hypothetical protein
MSRRESPAAIMNLLSKDADIREDVFGVHSPHGV